MNIVNGMIYMARRFKTATALNFVGLTVAFAAFYLLSTQVDYMQNYNRNIADYERVFRVEAKMNANAKWGTNINRPTLEMIGQMPQVEGLSLFGGGIWDQDVRVGESKLSVPATQTTRTPFAAMQRRCVDGELVFPEGDQMTGGAIITA